MRVAGMIGGPSAIGAQVDSSNSSAPPSGAPLSLVAADRLLLVGEARPVPDLDQHADAPRDEVGAAAQPRRLARPSPTQTWRSSAAWSSALDVVRAVLEAHAGCAACPARGSSTTCARSRAATSASTTTPRPMRARLRTAWKATCGSSAHAWTQRSPPLRSGSSVVAGERRQLAQRLGPAARRGRTVVAVRSNSDGPEAEGDREPRRRQAERLAGVVAAAPAPRR